MSRNSKILDLQTIEENISLLDVVNKYTVLSQKGNKYTGLCPFHEEKSPSFYITGNLYKCFGCGKGGTGVVSFIMNKENLSFIDTLKFLSKPEFIINTNKIIINKQIINKDPILYEFEDMPFTKKHHLYWNKGGLTEQFVKDEGDIYAVKKYAINKSVKYPKLDELMFGYLYKDQYGNETNQVKLLTIGPNVSKLDKWRTNVPNDKLWYLYKIKQNTNVFISKSNKDALVNMNCGIMSIATQSENDVILSKNIPFLKENYPNNEFIINFGTDQQGKECSIKVSKEYNLKWFNTPNGVLINDVNDSFSYVSTFGMKNYINLLKNKNYI